ncbi:hypothetical protein BDV96DRAFT_599759 [Lophiotrema nucula]|uniref:Uncharacterized protein n=1 Tax=Lophiotrema nucula TaxID=690887 RepID=A0A6A5Z8B8_9PLEO|nr:hypothetical protein BDV96DRAFT_599759 [Lophiotrema nucula]
MTSTLVRPHTTIQQFGFHLAASSTSTIHDHNDHQYQSSILTWSGMSRLDQPKSLSVVAAFIGININAPPHHSHHVAPELRHHRRHHVITTSSSLSNDTSASTFASTSTPNSTATTC